MKTKSKRRISVTAAACILSALLAGCGGKEVTEAVQTETRAKQEDFRDKPQQSMEMSEMQTVQISDEDAAALVQAGLDAVAAESDLWSITEIADTEVLMGLMQGQGGRERPAGDGSGGEVPENMSAPDGELGEQPDGQMPEGTMPEWDGEDPHENMEGTFPAGEMPEGGKDRGEGGGRQSGNRGGGMPALAIVIANAEDSTVEAEIVLTTIGAAAEKLGYSTMSMEIAEEQAALLEIPEGYAADRIILVTAQIPEVENTEAAG